MFFIAALLLLFVAVLFSSEKSAEFLWITLFVGSLYLLSPKEKISKFLDLKITTKALSIVKVTTFFIVIFLLIKSSLSTTYFLGGDDSRLFYIYPQEYLNNFILKTSNILGPASTPNILPPISIAPLIYTFTIFKQLVPFVNLQSFLYSLNLVLGFVFFYKFIIIATNSNVSKKPYLKVVFVLASVMYITSIFNVYVLYNSKLLSIYLLSIVPLILYLFIKSIIEAKRRFLFIIAVLSVIFSLLAVTLPWFGAYIIVCFPLLIIRLWSYKKRLFVYTLLLLFLVVVSNLYWIQYIASTSLINHGQNQGLVSESFRETNSTGIISTAQINEVFFPLLNTFHYKIQVNFNWPYLSIFNSWYAKILPVNILYLTMILFAGFITTRKNRWRKYYLASLIIFLISIYFFTLNIGTLGEINPGINFFVWLNNHIPGFVIFRNMYDKFSPALGFTYSIAFGVSLAIIIDRLKSIRNKNLLLLGVLLLILINAKPVLFGEFDKLPHWTTAGTYQKMNNLNQDYLSAMEYFKTLPADTRVLTLPLAHGNVTVIKDSVTDNNYYFGVSPVYLLSGVNDYPGIMSFGNSGENIKKLLFEYRYKEAANEIAKFSIDYVFVLNKIPEEIQNSYIYSSEFYKLQNDSFKSEIIGKEIKRFGNLYTLYEFNSHYEE